ncbi:MAG: diadenylate cyclase CdaA [Chloroflexi bacterium]|nr:diadenylate cyclase CdaA [Chloroflexota bacterium]
MEQLSETILPVLTTFRIWDLVDILTMAVVIYGLLSFFRGTTAVSVLYGLGLLLVAMLVVTSLPELTVLNWMLRNSLPFISVALVILFQPELRRAMERIGRVRGLLNRPLTPRQALTASRVIEEVARACRRLSERRQGALIVLERETGLQEFIESGVEVDAMVSMEMLATLFYPNSPLHDGATIIRGDRLVAAGCVLPLSTSSQDYDMGTRHRAALGITEETDAIAVIVSEETGTISVANDGRLVRHLDDARLRKVLSAIYPSSGRDVFPRWHRLKQAAEKQSG